jgi:hypothetical protein
MALLDILGASLAPAVAQAAQGQMSSPPAADPNDTVTVTAPPRNYGNTRALTGVRAALAAEPKPEGGSDNPGIFGLLPEHMQHGNLRNVLGALGDAFLVGSGRDRVYEPRMQRQEVANAMAGFETNPAMAASRVAGTAAPGSVDVAQKMFDQANNVELRKTQQDANNLYRQAQTDDRTQRTSDRRRGIVGGLLQAAAATGDPKKYAAARARALTMADGTDIDASELPESLEDYTGAYGATTGQVMRAQTGQASINERASAAQTAHQDRLRGQNLTHQASMAHGSQMTATTYLRKLADKQDGGEQLTPAEQQVWDKYTTTKTSKARGLLTTNGVAPTQKAPASGGQKFTHTATGPNGQRLGFDGKQWVPIK